MPRKLSALGIGRESLTVREPVSSNRTKAKRDPFAVIRHSVRNIDPDVLDAMIDFACKKARRETIAKLKKRP